MMATFDIAARHAYAIACIIVKARGAAPSMPLPKVRRGSYCLALPYR